MITITLTKEQAIVTQIALAIYSEQTENKKPVYDVLAKFDIKIYTIGAGTNQDVSFIPGRGYIRNEIDEETLKSISKRTNGQYFRATNLSGLEQIYDTIDTLERTEIEIKEFTQYKELFGWFLIPALILGLGGQTLDRNIFRKRL